MHKLTLAAIAAGVMLGFTIPTAHAAPPAAPAIGQSLATGGRLEPVQYWRRHCRRWNRECRARWGWGPRYRRCMIRRGC